MDSGNPNPVKAKEEIIQVADPLELKEQDDVLIKIADDRVEGSKGFFTKLRIKERQDRNFEFLFGRSELNEKNLIKKRIYSDNVLYEIESILKPLATSKDPDILVYPGQETPESQDSADQLTLALQHSINTRELKDVKALAFKHLPVYFVGAVKYRWNPEKGKRGDYEFMIVHPQNLVLDNNAKTRDVKKHEFIGDYLEVSVQELLMRFPEKKEELITKLIAQKKVGNNVENNQKALATKLKILELWFNYYEKKAEGWTKVSAVMWKYDDILFKKMKNPNWDWQGETHFFNYEDKIEPEVLMNAMQEKQVLPGFNTQQVYSNYFENPEFPYILIGYDQWGTMPLDETSRLEQLIRMQQNVNDRGEQIKKMLNRAMGKHIFSTKANLKAEDVEEMDWEDMDQAIIVDGDVNQTHAFANAEQPSAQIVNDYGSTRQIMFQKSHVNAISGVIQSSVATTNQIAREANFTYADDLVDATINYLSEQMARAILQLIKLRYTEEHFVRLIGSDGKVLFQRLHRDMIEDGMEVTITASGVDKLQRQNQAMDMAKLQLIDPLTFYEDIGAKNSQERTKRLMTFLTSPDQYWLEYVEGGVEAAGAKLNGTGQGGQQAMMDIAQLQEGTIPQVPQQVDQEYASALAQFLETPEFAALPPEFQQQVLMFAQEVQAKLEQGQAAQFNPPQQFGQAKGGGQLPGQVQNPTPTDTSQVAINPPIMPEGSPRNV